MEGKDNCAGTKAGRGNDSDYVAEFNGVYPIDDVLLWHHAILKEMNETLSEAKKLPIFGAH